MRFYAVFPLFKGSIGISGIYTTFTLALENARKAGGEWVIKQYIPNAIDNGVPIWCDWSDSGKDQELYKKHWPNGYPK